MKKNFPLLKISIAVLIASLSFTSNGQSIAEYDISITTIWTAEEHTSVPGNAHWSPLVGATHSTENQFMEIGAPASRGVKNVAETGNTNAITNEINRAINAGLADQKLQSSFEPFAAISSTELKEVTVSEDFPLITLISMIAPSPDWLIAVNSLNLRSGIPNVNNGWKESFSMDVYVYDSATDDGADYRSPNSPTTPPGTIYMRTEAPTNGNKMATISFTYKPSTLGVNDVNTIDNIKIHPNPSSGDISISNIRNNKIKTVEIYNILGGRLYKETVNPDVNKIDLNLSRSISKGIYLLKLESNNGSVKTQKLIIE